MSKLAQLRVRCWFLPVFVAIAFIVGACPASQPVVPKSKEAKQQLLTRRGRGGGNIDGGAAFAANGDIIFGSPNPGAKSPRPVCEIYRIKVDGSRRTRLAAGVDFDGHPHVALDGKTIAFISERTGFAKVFLMDSDGSNVRQLTQGFENDAAPVFSRDGKKLYFARRVSENPDEVRADELFSIDLDGKNEKRITNNSFIEAPVATSTDSSSLYYLCDRGPGIKEGGFNLMKIDLQKVITAPVLTLNISGNSGCDVSPDGQWAAYIDDSKTKYEYEVSVCKLDGTDKRKLTDLHGYIGDVRFAPDSKQVVFVAQRRSGPDRGRGDIYVATIDGQILKKVGPNWAK